MSSYKVSNALTVSGPELALLHDALVHSAEANFAVALRAEKEASACEASRLDLTAHARAKQAAKARGIGEAKLALAARLDAQGRAPAVAPGVYVALKVDASQERARVLRVDQASVLVEWGNGARCSYSLAQVVSLESQS